VAEVGPSQAEDQLYRLTFDGMVQEEHGFIVMGGTSEPISAVLRDEHAADASLDDAVRLALKALTTPAEGAERRDIALDAIEAAVLDRTRPRRAFKRLTAARLGSILGETSS